jgi:citrate synthase
LVKSLLEAFKNNEKFRKLAIQLKNHKTFKIMANTATIEVNGKKIELPVIEGTENELAIDISSFRSASGGIITIDPGFKNTGSCESGITFLDGEKGILRYRGYSIEELAEKADFLEVAYLLIFGELPTKEQHQKFHRDIKAESIVDEDIKKILEAFPKSAHPMGVISSLTSALTAFNPSSVNVNSEADMYRAIVKIMGKFPVLVAWTYRRKLGLPLDYGDDSLGYVENILKMMFRKPNADYVQNKILIDALDKLLILHADHEQNCSTSTVRIAGSSHAGLFASLSAGISALWGPLHGGANQAVLEMLEAIKNDDGDTKKYMAKAKDKDDPFRLMGFGHRVYKNFDPRAKIIKKAADEVLANLGIEDPILDIAKGLEKEALEDQYFVDRKLYPNVDFYSGIIYRGMGIPTDMFTVMFALGRLPGWIAQWREMRLRKEPIGRPRQIYTGATQRSFVALEKR